MLFIMLFPLLATLGVPLTQAQAQPTPTCWRDTPCDGPRYESFYGRGKEYSFSPLSRTVEPVSVSTSNRTQVNRSDWTFNATQNFLIFDFGKEVGGVVHIEYNATRLASFSLAFSEAKGSIGPWSDNSNGAFNTDGFGHADGYIRVNVTEEGAASYTLPDAQMRGGFRYLSLFADRVAGILFTNITCELSFQPSWPNLQAYGGYFDSSDESLARIWYAGAYTLQTNAIPPTSGRAFPIVASGWQNDALLNAGGANGSTIYVDGTSSGELPFAGPAILAFNSDTYHMATMIATYEYYLFTGDHEFMKMNYENYKKGLSFIIGKIDHIGMLSVTGTQDWGRLNQGGRNTEANMLLYHTLVTASKMACWMEDASLSSELSQAAESLKAAVNANNWDPSVGAFKDSDTDASIHPQDGNSMAILFGVANDSFVPSISEQLTTNWIDIGSVAPELPGNLVGFGQSFEVKAHFAAGQISRGLDLIKRAWGWYLSNPAGTQSTCIEGYLASGTFGYRSTFGYQNDYSYTSHSHGWSTGPIDALMTYVLGLQLIEPKGSIFRLAPQPGNLTSVAGGFTTPLGRFEVRYNSTELGYYLFWDCPDDSAFTLVLPGFVTGNEIVEHRNTSDGRMTAEGFWDEAQQTKLYGVTGGEGAVVVTTKV